MAPKQAAQRCHAAIHAHNRASSSAPSQAIWLTDSVLSRAFDRYCNVTKVAQRCQSTVPGPLESRKRLGRRHMGLSLPQSQSPLPPWMLPDAIDCSDWQWLAPSSRNPRAQAVEPASWMPQWLRPTLDGEEVAGASAESSDMLRPDVPRKPVEVLQSQDSGPVSFARLLERAEKLATGRRDNPNETQASFATFITSFELSLASGQLGATEIDTILSLCVKNIAHARQSQVKTNDISFMMVEGVSRGITSCQVLPRSNFHGNIWRTLLSTVARMDAEFTRQLQAVKVLISSMPSTHLKHVTKQLSAALRSLIRQCQTHDRAAQGYDATSKPRLDMISDIFSHVDIKLRPSLLRDLTVLMSKSAMQIRRSWLKVLAHQPCVNDFALHGSWSVLSAVEKDHVPEAHLCDLLMSQWTSRAQLADAQRTKAAYEAHMDVNVTGASPLLLLALSLFETESWARSGHLLTCYWKFVEHNGDQEKVVQSLRIAKHTLNSPQAFVALLARTSQSRDIALQIHRSFLDSYSTRCKEPWDPSILGPYLEEIVADPTLPASTVLSLLSERKPSQAGKPISYHTFASKKEIIHLLSAAPQISNRQVRRHVASQLRIIAERQGGRLDSQDLTALAVAVTRDLSDGRHDGIYRRLEWLLHDVREHLGEKVAAQAERELERWMRANKLIWKGKWVRGEAGFDDRRERIAT